MSNTTAAAQQPGAAAAAKAGAADAPRPLDAGAVTKRLQQELMSLMMGGDQGISAFPDGDSLFSWVGTITVGPAARGGAGRASGRVAGSRRRPCLVPARVRAAPGAQGPVLLRPPGGGAQPATG